MVEPLPLNVQWHRGETALSLGKRLARRNFASSMNLFGQDIGLDFSRLGAGERDAVERLAALAGVPLGDLEASTLVRSGANQFVVNGQSIDRSTVRLTTGRFCPACLVQSEPYSRLWWAINPCRLCIEHSMPHQSLATVEVYDRKQDPAGFFERNWDLIVAMHGSAEHVVAHPGEHYLRSRLQGNISKPSWLDGVGFSAAAKAMDVFGAIDVFGQNVVLGRLDTKDLTRAAAAGYAILKGGEPAIRQFLADMLGRPGLPPNAGPQNIFGAIYRWLAHSETSDLEMVRDVVREFTLDHIAIEPGTLFLGKEVVQRRLHSIITVVNMFGHDRRTTRKLLEAAGLVGVDDQRPERLIAFPVEAAEKALRKYVDSVTLIHLDAYLNMPERHRNALVASGHLKPVVRSPGLKPFYHKKDLDHFLERLFESAVPATEDSSKQPVSIANIAKYDRRCTAPKVVDLILNRKLKWVGKQDGVHGYGGVLVDYKEVSELLEGKTPSRLPKSYWIREFGANEKAINSAIKGMKVKIVSEISPISHQWVQYVPDAEISRIRETFVSLRNLSRDRGQHWQITYRDLKRSGIHPIDAGDARLIIYRRSDIV